MGMIYKFGIYKAGGSAERFGDTDYDTREEAEAAFAELTEQEQEEYQVAELGYNDGQ